MLPELNLSSLELPLLSLVAAAGQSLCTVYRQQNIEVFRKKDGSPVTSADQESHCILKKGLERLLPSVPVISEEDPLSWQIKSSLYWLIDPLDGTHGFIHKSDEFCINIALIKDRCPILGLIHLPLTEETYYGYGETAWHSKEGLATPITTRSPSSLGLKVLLGGGDKNYDEGEESVLKNYKVTNVQRVKSAIKFCYIAAGEADLYLRVKPCSEWDTAAGQALVHAAGGGMTTLEGTPIFYGKKNLIDPSFIVFGKQNDSSSHS